MKPFVRAVVLFLNRLSAIDDALVISFCFLPSKAKLSSIPETDSSRSLVIISPFSSNCTSGVVLSILLELFLHDHAKSSPKKHINMINTFLLIDLHFLKLPHSLPQANLIYI